MIHFRSQSTTYALSSIARRFWCIFWAGSRSDLVASGVFVCLWPVSFRIRWDPPCIFRTSKREREHFVNKQAKTMRSQVKSLVIITTKVKLLDATNRAWALHLSQMIWSNFNHFVAGLFSSKAITGFAGNSVKLLCTISFANTSFTLSNKIKCLNFKERER